MTKGKWQILKIKDYPIKIIDGDRGSNYPSKEEFSDNGFCLFLNTGNVTLNGFDFSETSFISKEKHEQLRKGHVNRGDVVLTTRGTIGNCGYYGPQVEHDVIRINSGMLILRPNTEKLDRLFFYQLIKSNIFQQQAELFKYGAAQPQLPIATLKYIRLPLPPLPIQQKIAGVLSAYEDLIEVNLRRIKLLEEMAQTTYEEWFLRLRFPNHENTPINAETGLPDGWKKKSLSSLGTFMNGFAFKPDDLGIEGLPVIKIKEIKAGIVSDTPRNTGERVPTKYLVSAGDILFSWSASLEVVIWSYEVGLINQHLFKVIPNDGIPRAFLYLATKDSLKIFDSLTTGATMKHIKRKELDFVEVNVSDSELLYRFGAEVDRIIDSALNLSRQNQLLKEARNLLLPRLMTGLIDIDDYLARNGSAAVAA